MRLQLIWCIRMLADKQYQQKVWFEQQPPGLNYYDSIDDVIHCLFDDTPIVEAPDDTIGYILKSQDEAKAMSLVGKAIEKVLENLPQNSSSEAFVNSDYWADVVSMATTAYKISGHLAPLPTRQAVLTAPLAKPF